MAVEVVVWFPTRTIIVPSAVAPVERSLQRVAGSSAYRFEAMCWLLNKPVTLSGPYNKDMSVIEGDVT
jgi:hypothetical protein